jgi:hypothetical protein
MRRSQSKSQNKKDKEVSSTPLEVEDEEVMGTTMLVQDKMTTG